MTVEQKEKPRRMVIEVNIYPTDTVTDTTPKITFYAAFDRNSITDDAIHCLEYGPIALVNCVRRLRERGFKLDPPTEIDGLTEDDADADDN